MCARVHVSSLVLTLGLSLAAMPASAQTPRDGRVAAEMRSGVPAGDPLYVADAAGLSNSGYRLTTVEPTAPPAPTERRLVIIGGLDGHTDSTGAVLDFLRWWFADPAARAARRTWQIAVMPCALPDGCAGGSSAPSSASAPLMFPPEKGFFDDASAPEARYVWRWTAMEGPDLVIDVRAGARVEWVANALAAGGVSGAAAASPDSFAGALGTGAPSGLAPVGALELRGPRVAVARELQQLVRGALPAVSPMRQALERRAARAPLDIARMLASRYPANPIMSYIPALSWSGALRVSQVTGDATLRERAAGQMQAFLSGAKAPIAEPYLLTSLAGHQAFADWAALDSRSSSATEAATLARRAADFMLPGPDAPAAAPTDPVRFATRWTDDMFMATSVLARVAASTGEAKYADAAQTLLTGYAARLQRPDGIFVHAENGPHAWGRGNGFAAFGLMEALTHLPESWSGRATVLDIFRTHMRALATRQAPDGSWRQVVDEPGTYREFTATAMIYAAMARGVRRGWLDASYAPVVDKAWRAVAIRIAEDGALVDVCTGTGAGRDANEAYYLHRPALFGPDDRGGAMGLTAALETYERRR